MRKMNIFFVLGLMITNLSFMQNEDEKDNNVLLCNLRINEHGKIVGIQGSPNFAEGCKEYINEINLWLGELLDSEEKMNQHRKLEKYDTEIKRLETSINNHTENTPEDESLEQKQKKLRELIENKPSESLRLSSQEEEKIISKLSYLDQQMISNQKFELSIGPFNCEAQHSR